MRRRLLAFFALVHSLAPANPASGAKPISDPSCREAFVAASQLNAAFWSTCVAMADQAILDGTYFDAFCKDGILYCCNESYCVEMASGRVQLELESLPLGGIDVEPVVVPIVQSAPTRPSDAFLTFQSLAGEPSAPAPGGDPAALREVVAQPAFLEGRLRLAAHGFHDKRPTRMALLHHDGRVLVAGIGHAGNTYEGRLGPDGRRGKHQLYLDAESADTLAEDVVEEGSSARGIPTGPVVGHHVQLWLRSRNGGELALQLEGEVFTEGLGEISVRARVRDSAPAQ